MRKIQLKAFYVFSILAASYLASYSQAPSIEWQKTFGGTGDDRANYIEQTNDGGYIVAGIAASKDGDVNNNHGNWDCWIIKLNNAGDTLWTKTYGGSKEDGATSIKQTTDGGYIVAGYTYSDDGDITKFQGITDCWILKLNSSGDTIWTKTLGGSAYDEATSIQQTSDGGYIVSAITESNDGDVSSNHGKQDYWVVKLNNLGVIEWQKNYGGSDNDQPYSIQQTKDGGFILAGYAASNDGDVKGNHGQEDYWIVKLNNNGDTLWTKTYGGSDFDIASSIEQTTDGGYIVGGFAASNDGDVKGLHGTIGNYDSWILKLNSNGDTVWTKTLGGSDADGAYFITQTSDGGYIATGGASSKDGDVSGNHGSSDYWVTKLKSNGDTLWTKSLGGSNGDESYCIQQTNDGKYIIAGNTTSNDGDVTNNHNAGIPDYWIVKLNNDNILPVTLLNFIAQKQKNVTFLQWQTTNELNNSYFSIERSSNLKTFSGIGIQAASKTKSINNYSFTDIAPLNGMNYYRLKQVDKDGKFSYSKTLSLFFEHTKTKLYPNPSHDGKFNFELANTHNDIKVSVTDEAGHIIYNKIFTQTNNINLVIPNNRGTYFAKIQFDNIEENYKLVID